MSVTRVTRLSDGPRSLVWPSMKVGPLWRLGPLLIFLFLFFLFFFFIFLARLFVAFRRIRLHLFLVVFFLALDLLLLLVLGVCRLDWLNFFRARRRLLYFLPMLGPAWAAIFVCLGCMGLICAISVLDWVLNLLLALGVCRLDWLNFFRARRRHLYLLPMLSPDRAAVFAWRLRFHPRLRFDLVRGRL